MKVLETIVVEGGGKARKIEIAHGDLMTLDAAAGVDILVVSTFPRDYSPTEESLIGQLAEKGISVKDLAQEKAVDLLTVANCWLSKPIDRVSATLPIGRILCFESPLNAEPPERVGDVFRSLVPIVDSHAGATVAMPLVACGNQGTPVEVMAGPMLEAAVNWLRNGLPLDRLLIVERDAEKAERLAAAAAAFARPEPVPTPSSSFAYDVFVSYSHKNAVAADALVSAIREHRPNTRIFLDRLALKPGCAWQKEIFEALDASRRVVALYSPDYLASKICAEEFNIALMRHHEEDAPVLFPILLHSAVLPGYMKTIQYVDCREGNLERLRAVSPSDIGLL